MSKSELFSDILHGNFTNAWHRLVDWYSGWPPELKTFVGKVWNDEVAILWDEGRKALAGAQAGQSVAQIADAAWNDVQIKVPGAAKEDFMNILGVLLRAG